MNLYGFKRILKGVDKGAYFHPSFHRDRPDDVANIKRVYSNKKDEELEEELLRANQLGGSNNNTSSNHLDAMAHQFNSSGHQFNPNEQMEYLTRYLNWNKNFPPSRSPSNVLLPNYDSSFLLSSHGLNMNNRINPNENMFTLNSSKSQSVPDNDNYADELLQPHKLRRGDTSLGSQLGLSSIPNNSQMTPEEIFQYSILLQQQQILQQQNNSNINSALKRQIFEALENNHQKFYEDQQTCFEYLKKLYTNKDNSNISSSISSPLNEREKDLKLDLQISEVVLLMESRHKQFFEEQQQFYVLLKKS